MIQKIRVADTESRLHGAGSLVWCAIYQTPDSRLDQCSGTHRTRLDRRVDIYFGQPVITYHSRGLPKSYYFRMCRGITIRTRAIARNGKEHFATDETGADGHFVP